MIEASRRGKARVQELRYYEYTNQQQQKVPYKSAEDEEMRKSLK